jgi:hypothetical protein
MTTITSVIPNNGIDVTNGIGPITGGTLIQINGSGFNTASTVVLNTTTGTNFFANNTTINVTIPSNNAGNVTLYVKDNVDAVLVTSIFTYYDYPTITSIVPTIGPLIGSVVTVNGTNYSTITSVTLNDVSLSYVNPTPFVITTSLPSNSAGQSTIKINTLNGTASTIFTYVDPPIITNTVPNIVALTGSTITMNGFNFYDTVQNPLSLTIGASPLAITSFTQSTITATTPSLAANTYALQVNALGVLSNTSNIIYVNAPTITSIVPNSLFLSGGTITINGTNFYSTLQNPLSLTIGSSIIAITSFTETTITTTVPASSIGVYPLQVNSIGVLSNTSNITYVDSPVITSIVPDIVPLNGSTITINGTNFNNVLQITCDGVPVNFASTIFTSTIEISTVLPSLTAGTKNVIVIVQAGASLPSPVTYVDSPTITSIVPNITPLSGSNITITGSNFYSTAQSPLTLTIGSSPIAITSFTQTSITATAPALAGGIQNVIVNAVGGSIASSIIYADSPTISNIVPNVVPSTIASAVTIYGTDFYSTAQNPLSLKIGSSQLAITSFTQTSISTIVPPSTIGTYQLEVTAVGGVSNQSSILYVTTPIITSIVPNIGPLTGSNITINGTDFYSTAQNPLSLTFGSSQLAITSFTDSTIVATTPASTIGAYTLRVTAVGGLSNPSDITYVSNPIITSIVPDGGFSGGNTSITINGSNFFSSIGNPLSVTIGSPVTITSFTTSTISGTTNSTSPGIYDVIVNASGGSTLFNGYKYANAPTISSLNPSSGPTIGNVPITISGTNFITTSTIALNITMNSISVPGISVSVPVAINSSTLITVTPPPLPSSTYNLVVSTIGGVASTIYTYFDVLKIDSIVPAFGATNKESGQGVTITGTEFSNVTAVKINSYSMAFLINSPTQIVSVFTKSSKAGTQTVLLYNNTGYYSPTTGKFTYVDPPTITNILPNSGRITGGTEVTITGTNFIGTDDIPISVKIGGVQATIISPLTVTPASNTSTTTPITLIVPPNVAGLTSTSVDILTVGGSITLANAFTYTSPTITSIVPNIGPLEGGTFIRINGTLLSSINAIQPNTPTVTIGTNLVTNLGITDTQITGNTPLGSGEQSLVISWSNISISSIYDYSDELLIRSIYPTGGTIDGGTPITINGKGFFDSLTITIDGNAVNGFTVDPSNTFISAITPPGSIGIKEVKIVRTTLTTTTNAYFYFNYLSPIPDPPYTDKLCRNPPYNATNFTSANSTVYNTLVSYAKNSPNYPWNTSTNPQDVYKSQQNTVYFNTLNQKTIAVKTANDNRITAGLPGNMPYPAFKSQTERLMYTQGLTLTAARNKMTGENPSRPMGVPCSTIYNIINS